MEAKKGLELEVEERKQVEEALRESEDNIRAVLESTADGILAVDTQGKVRLSNRIFTEMWHIPRELLDTDKDDQLINYVLDQLTDPEAFVSKVELLYRSLEEDFDELSFKDGRIFERFSRPLKRNGMLDGRVWSFRDVTERKQAEKEKENLEIQLRQSQKMEAISSLAGGIAHDFNNILSAIIGYVQLAQTELDPESEPYVDLKEVLQSGNRAKLLIQQILAIGRDQEQERQPIHLKYIVKEALKFLKSTLPSTIEIQEKIDRDVGMIDADPTRMHQVIMNLCTNAGHAMAKSGGILEVSLQNAQFGLGNAELNLEPGGYLRLSVSDTGYGMTPEVMEKIFDPYFTTKEKGEGTGIGLSVVHGIVTQHGGDITVESEPGKGSTFHVYLPLSQGEEEQPEVEEETPVPKGNERILFIDDEAALANMGKKMLQHLGYYVTAMTGSIEALALFRKDPKQFDLVITDTTMPHMPGDTLAQEMMKIRPDIPVVISTGHSKRISPEKAKEMGIKGFLMKPLIMRILAETVRRALD